MPSSLFTSLEKTAEIRSLESEGMLKHCLRSSSCSNRHGNLEDHAGNFAGAGVIAIVGQCFNKHLAAGVGDYRLKGDHDVSTRPENSLGRLLLQQDR